MFCPSFENRIKNQPKTKKPFTTVSGQGATVLDQVTAMSIESLQSMVESPLGRPVKARVVRNKDSLPHRASNRSSCAIPRLLELYVQRHFLFSTSGAGSRPFGKPAHTPHAGPAQLHFFFSGLIRKKCCAGKIQTHDLHLSCNSQ